MNGDIGNYVHISVRNLTTRMVGSFMLGASMVGAGQAYINSVTSVGVAVQHGQELEIIRTNHLDLEQEVVRRMANGWTRTDQNDYQQRQRDTDAAQNRRIEALERIVDQL